MTKGLMDRALHNETALERVRDKARLAKEELLELKNWKVVTKKKLKLAKQARDEYQRTVEELKAVLEDKEDELRLAKKKAVQELSVRPKLYTLSLTSQPSTSTSRRVCLSSQTPLMIQLTFSQRKGPSPSSLSLKLKKEKLQKLKTPSSLTCSRLPFFLSILKTLWIFARRM